MRIRNSVCAIAFLAIALPTYASWLSDVTGVNIDLNKQIGTGVSGMAQPTINAFETSGHRLIENADRRAEARIAQVDTVLTKQLGEIDRIAQTRIEDLDLRIEQRIAQIDRMAASRLDQVDRILGDNIKRVDATAAARIAQIDSVLQARTADVDAMLKADIREIDERIGIRIEQLDQMTERRLGNLDTIASKSSATLSAALLRLVAFACIVIFAAAALWRIYVESTTAWPKVGSLFARLRQWWGAVRGRLFWQVGAAAVCVLILFVGFVTTLPIDGSNALAKAHEVDFLRSMRALDLINAKYHASQLKILDPPNPVYRAYALKVDLMRDVLTRPALYQTAAGLTETIARIEQVEAQFHPARDPDIETLKALVVFRTHPTRENEHRAAMLCASALDAPPPARTLAGLLGRSTAAAAENTNEFALRPLTLAYIDNYLSHPLPVEMQPDAGDAEAPKHYSPEQLRQILTKHRRNEKSRRVAQPLHALAQVLAYDQLVRDLTSSSVPAYFRMVQQQALLERAPEADRAAIVAKRNAEAQTIIGAFQTFDSAIDERRAIGESSAAYAVFALNDAIYTRARAYLQPNTNAVPPKLDATNYSSDSVRVQMLPPRTVWAKRYLSGLETTLDRVITYQEAEQFKKQEAAAIQFETAYINFARTNAAFQEKTPRDLVDSGIKAATAAAGMGLAFESTDVATAIVNDVRARLTPQLMKELGFDAQIKSVTKTAQNARVAFI